MTSWQTLDPAIRQLAESLLTPRQLEILRLEAAGRSQRAIAWELDIAKSTVTDHIDTALKTLRRHGVHRVHGVYYREDAA